MYSTPDGPAEIDAAAIAAQVQATLIRHPSLRLLARVQEGGAYDIALLTPTHQCVLIRCAEPPTQLDFHTLTAVMTEGPFDEAILVSRSAFLESPVMSCPIGQIDSLFRRLDGGAAPWT